MAKNKKKVGFLGCPSAGEMIVWFVVGFIITYFVAFIVIILTK
jgi:hypothetical protein